MSAATFIVDLIRALAWPGVVVTILLIFRRQFGIMLERLSRVGLGVGGDDGSDWGQATSSIRQSLASGRPGLPGRPDATQPGAQAGPQAGTKAGQRGQAGPPPPQVLLEDRWQALTAELREVVLRSGSVGDEQLAGFGFDQLLEAALRAGLLDSATMRSLDGLRSLRNLTRTSDTRTSERPDRPDSPAALTERQAQEFTVLADAVSYTMRRDRRTPAWPAR